VPNASVSLALPGAEAAGWDGVLADGVLVDGVLVDGVLVLGLWPSPCSAAIASAPARITKAIAAINLMTHLTDRPHQASGYPDVVETYQLYPSPLVAERWYAESVDRATENILLLHEDQAQDQAQWPRQLNRAWVFEFLPAAPT
jgi:hypothetical protein